MSVSVCVCVCECVCVCVCIGVYYSGCVSLTTKGSGGTAPTCSGRHSQYSCELLAWVTGVALHGL